MLCLLLPAFAFPLTYTPLIPPPHTHTRTPGPSHTMSSSSLGRLTRQQLEEGRRQAEAAYEACMELQDRWSSEAPGDRQLVEGAITTTAAAVAAVRRWLPRDHGKVRGRRKRVVCT